jgi:hypothetical protein
MYFVVNASNRRAYCNGQPLYTYNFAIQGNKCTLTIGLILRFDFMEKIVGKDEKNIAV